MKVHFWALSVFVSFLTACTPPIDLPKGFWDMLYAAEAARVEASRDLRDLYDHTSKGKNKDKVWPDCYTAGRALYDQASVDWNTLYYTTAAIFQSNRPLSGWPAYDAKLEEAMNVTADFFAVYKAAVGHGIAMIGNKTSQHAKDCTGHGPDISSEAATFWPSPVFNAISLTDLVNKVSEMNRNERDKIAKALGEHMWTSSECLLEGAGTDLCKQKPANTSGTTP
jgi:hypothetical protein